MDEADQASGFEQLRRDIAMTIRKPTIDPCGLCHFCGANINPAHLFCDCHCATDWQRRQDAKIRNGTP